MTVSEITATGPKQTPGQPAPPCTPQHWKWWTGWKGNQKHVGNESIIELNNMENNKETEKNSCNPRIGSIKIMNKIGNVTYPGKKNQIVKYQ